MTLLLNEKETLKLQGKPGLHVFIAGVSHYRHLPGGTGTPASRAYGMQQLSSTALTAYKVYEWLRGHEAQLPLPLATVRLLLSPSAEESAAEPKLAGLADICTRRNFAVEAHAWRADASASDGDMALFYFAGHGVQRRKNDAVMLMEDFSDPFDGPLTNAVAIDNFLYGMAPPADPTKKIARRQLYFIDACRIAPKEFNASEWLNVPDLWAVEKSGPDDRLAAAFFAAIPGTKAYALKAQHTIFSQALIKCLEGSGGEPMEEDEQGRVRWRVSVYSLARALKDEIEELNRQHQSDQQYEPGMRFDDMLVAYLTGPPRVSVSLEIEPADALPYITIEVTNHEDNAVWSLSPPVNPHPYVNELPAGVYSFRASVAGESAPAALSLNGVRRLRQIMPPRAEWKARVVQ